jgi:hypothetical protein
MRKLLFLPVLFAFELPAWAQGCAMCRTALESSPEGRLLASSFAHGILMMMFLPYAIIGTAGFVLYRAYRKKQKVSRESH